MILVKMKHIPAVQQRSVSPQKTDSNVNAKQDSRKTERRINALTSMSAEREETITVIKMQNVPIQMVGSHASVKMVSTATE